MATEPRTMHNEIEQEHPTDYAAVRPFKPGDVVVDRDAEDKEASRAVVLRVLPYRAFSAGVVLETRQTTVARMNPCYPADDFVIRVGHVAELDDRLPDWREHAPVGDDRRGGMSPLYGYILAHCRQHGEMFPWRDYPHSRLVQWGTVEIEPDNTDEADTAPTAAIVPLSDTESLDTN